MIEEMADEFVAMTAIVAIVVMEWHALSKGVNGVGFSTALAAIAGIAGYKIREAKNKFK